jgi:hypothetical protein
MTKAPFTGQSERASDLLGLVHTDVCGSMSYVARGGFQYFITFTVLPMTLVDMDTST